MSEGARVTESALGRGWKGQRLATRSCGVWRHMRTLCLVASLFVLGRAGGVGKRVRLSVR